MFDWFSFLYLWFGIAIAILMIVAYVKEYYTNKRETRVEKNSFGVATLIFAFIVPLGLMIGIVMSWDMASRCGGPTALDVYRGRTELKINETVQGADTLNRDTTVVFKD